MNAETLIDNTVKFLSPTDSIPSVCDTFRSKIVLVETWANVNAPVRYGQYLLSKPKTDEEKCYLLARLIIDVFKARFGDNK